MPPSPSSSGRLATANLGPFGRTERALAGLCLAVLSNALVGPLLAPDQGDEAEGAVLRVMWLPVYAVGVLLLARSGARAARLWPAMLAGAVLLAWPIASLAWSIDPELTQRRCIALVFTTLFGLALAARFRWGEIVRLVAVTYGVLAALSYGAVLLFPAWGVNHSTNPGDWKGVWYEKNALGGNMAIGALAALCAGLIARERRGRWLALMGLCLGLVIMSRSKTALMVFLAGAAVAGVLALARRGPGTAVLAVWAGGLGAGVVGGVLWLAPGVLLKALGKDPTLTGRTDIWASLMRRVAEHPWLGYGYSAFWSNDRHGPAAVVRKETKWLVPSAHNGWLDLLVQLGWIGVGLFAAFYLATLVAAAQGGARRGDGGFAPIYVLVFGMFSLSESFILQHNSISWVLLVAVAGGLFARPGPMRSAEEAGAPRPSASPPGATVPRVAQS